MTTTNSNPTTTEEYLVHLGPRGRIVIPAEARQQLGLQEGERLVLKVLRDGALRIERWEEHLRRIQGIYADIEPERCLSEELIAERRAEARRENDS